ncbi:MAG: hypothetical protein KAR21_19125 [Spirochaetales bacterium]|nr:hypothetical protein [Spirochaetales bacterium]
MLSEEEKRCIIEKVQFENSMRKELTTPDKPKKLSWLNSKLSLLLIGALITGILVPWFQYTYKTIEWKRQNEFENINFRLGMMRESLKEFVYLTVYTAEAYERIKPFMDTVSLTPNDYEKFEEHFINLQNRRFRQNAKVTSLIIYFEDSIIMKRLFRDYVNNASDHLSDLRRFVQSKNKDSNKEILEKLRIKIENYSTELNRLYIRVISKMKDEIGRVEDESESYG